MAERLYSTYQVADLLGATPSTVVTWMQKGWLPFERLADGPVRVSERGLISFLKRQNIDIEEVMAKTLDQHGQAQPAVIHPERAEPRPAIQGEVDGHADEREQEIIDATVEPADQRPASSDSRQPAHTDPPPASTVEPSLVTGNHETVQATGQHEAAAAPDPSESSSTESWEADPVSQVLQAILADAVARRASHIHLEQRHDEMLLRMRIDGVMHEKASFGALLPESVAPRLIEGIKSLTKAAPAGKGACFDRPVDGRPVRFRLIGAATRDGQKIVLTVLDPQVAAQGLERLNLSTEGREQLALLAAQPEGLIVVAGPRRGRDQLLAATAQEADPSQRSVAMIGARASCEMAGVTHYPAESDLSESLVSLVALDADVISIGQLSSEADVLGALSAAADGCLVLAGVAAEDVAGALELLLSAKPDPWVLASSLRAIVASRQARRLCDQCKSPRQPSDELLARLHLPGGEAAAQVWAPGQCDECGGTGYRGLASLLSVLAVDGPIAGLLRGGSPMEDVLQAAGQARMMSLRQVGLEAVRAGVTSFQELRRVLPWRTSGLSGGQ